MYGSNNCIIEMSSSLYSSFKEEQKYIENIYL